MVHDNYHPLGSQPSHDNNLPMTPPYPSGDFDPIPDPKYYQTPPSQTSQHVSQDSHRGGRSRASSSATSAGYSTSTQQPPPPPAKPIYDAVNSAFDHSSAVNQLPQTVIAQITEQVRTQVIDSLRAELQQNPTLGPATSSPRQTGRSISPNARVSPRHLTPSPDRRSNAGSTLGDYKLSHTSQERYGAPTGHPETIEESPSPLFPTRDDANVPSLSAQDRFKEDLTGRYGDRSEFGSRARPLQSPRLNSGDEETIVEKMWQPLFDSDGRPTLRLGQFLRGLALHIVEDIEPKQSLVINPAKMYHFFTSTRIMSETYDWATIFHSPPLALSTRYRDLRCQHYFIQNVDIPEHRLHTDVPAIPALTPDGFAAFMIQLIQANPSTEFERLGKVARDMPISNADDRKERLPKELSRRLLPKFADPKIRAIVDAALSTGSGPSSSSAQRESTLPPPPSPVKRNTTSGLDGSGDPAKHLPQLRRERAPYNHSGSSAIHDSSVADESDSDFKPSIPIERERKPYTAKEGTGKHYDSNASAGIPVDLPQLSQVHTTGHGLGSGLGAHSQLSSSYPSHGPGMTHRSSTSAAEGLPIWNGGPIASFPPPPREAVGDRDRGRDRDRDRDREREQPDRNRDRDYERGFDTLHRTYSKSSRRTSSPPLSYSAYGSGHPEREHYGPVFEEEEGEREKERRRERDRYESVSASTHPSLPRGQDSHSRRYGSGETGLSDPQGYNPPLGTGERRYG